MPGEAAHMHFVDDGPGGRPVEWRVTFPIVRTQTNHHTLHSRRAIVAFLPAASRQQFFGTTVPRPYGSRRTLTGSKRIPLGGS